MTFAYALTQPAAVVGPTYDAAVSPAALSLRRTIAETLESHQSLVARRADEIVGRLVSELQRASVEDGIHATSGAVARAASVLRSIPSEYPLPTVVVESDHEIGLDWDEGVRRVLSVSIGDGPMLGYAALIGAEPSHGRVAFTGVFPTTLSYFVRRIYGHQR